MMVNYLLCKSELFQNTATAVVDMLGGVGESFMGSCSPKRHLPHLILHGTVDPIITYDRDNIVDGSNFISTRKLTDAFPAFFFLHLQKLSRCCQHHSSMSARSVAMIVASCCLYRPFAC
jgi:hypothetical protein